MNEKQKKENNKDLQIKDSDIATIEAMHDLILDNTRFNLEFSTLKKSRLLTKKMHSIIDNQPKKTIISKTILEEANDIIFNRAEEKQREYGPIDESLHDASEVASMIQNRTFTTDDVYAVLIGLKISRMRWNKKHDTFLDSIGYIAAYEAYIRKTEKQNKNE